jgi:hypothetical protein
MMVHNEMPFPGYPESADTGAWEMEQDDVMVVVG